jgi:hypothetical protein
MKNAVFWDLAQCRYCVNLLTLVHHSRISYTLKMEAIRSCETSVNKISTRRYIPEDGILQKLCADILSNKFIVSYGILDSKTKVKERCIRVGMKYNIIRFSLY